MRYHPFPNSKLSASYSVKKPTWDNDPNLQRIAQYFHNSSSSCTDWSVRKFSRVDEIWDGHNLEDANYQTEHPFEAQTLARFFDYHLTQRARNPLSKSWILAELHNNRQPYQGATAGVTKMAADELGTVNHLDRLAIFLTDPNRMKGNLFSHKDSPSATLKFHAMQAGDEQILRLKDLGMIFTVSNNLNPAAPDSEIPKKRQSNLLIVS